MNMKLSKEQIVDFIENYGNEDAYFSHEYKKDGSIIVNYIPNAGKCLSDKAIEKLKKEMMTNQRLYAESIRTVCLYNNYCQIYNKNRYTDLSLEKNYEKFLFDISKEEYTL